MKDPSELVAVGDVRDVRMIDVDLKRGISASATSKSSQSQGEHLRETHSEVAIKKVDEVKTRSVPFIDILRTIKNVRATIEDRRVGVTTE